MSPSQRAFATASAVTEHLPIERRHYTCLGTKAFLGARKRTVSNRVRFRSGYAQLCAV
ncbi:MAG: hypothetical protein KDK90_28490 [Leptospiraceae bacterium]|nr:hypothetical protein [Leptospiraceae bacterium]